MKRNLKQDELSAIRESIESAVKKSGLRMVAVYLHGSYGTEYMRDESDIDIAFLSEIRLTREESIIFSVALQQAWGDERIDVADLRQSDTVFVAQVVANGERIYTGNELAAQRFEMTALSKYARLNEERAAIIADIKQRGKVYGSGAQSK